MKAIQVNELTRQYGAYTAVDHIIFSAEQGQLIGFLGVNGAGKSTTINMMSTLLTPTSGSIEICGADVQQDSRLVREKIGIVYQNNVLDDLLTVRENLLCSSRTGRTAYRASVSGILSDGGVFYCRFALALAICHEMCHNRYNRPSQGKEHRHEGVQHDCRLYPVQALYGGYYGQRVGNSQARKCRKILFDHSAKAVRQDNGADGA